MRGCITSRKGEEKAARVHTYDTNCDNHCSSIQIIRIVSPNDAMNYVRFHETICIFERIFQPRKELADGKL